ERGVDAERGQGLHGVAHALGHAFGGAAGGRGQGDARGRAAGLQRLRDQQHQHAGDGGGLAGAGAAGDQQQVVVERGGGGLGLEVAAGRGRGEELGEEVGRGGGDLGGFVAGRRRGRAPICPSGIFPRRRGKRCGGGAFADAAQAGGQAALVLAVAAQVEQAVFEDEGRFGGGFGVAGVRPGDPVRGGQGLAPGLGGGPVDRDVDQLVRLRGIEASVACGNGQRGQGGGGENGVGGVRVEAAQAFGQSVVEGAEVAASVEGAEEGH